MKKEIFMGMRNDITDSTGPVTTSKNFIQSNRIDNFNFTNLAHFIEQVTKCSQNISFVYFQTSENETLLSISNKDYTQQLFEFRPVCKREQKY